MLQPHNYNKYPVYQYQFFLSGPNPGVRVPRVCFPIYGLFTSRDKTELVLNVFTTQCELPVLFGSFPFCRCSANRLLERS